MTKIDALEGKRNRQTFAAKKGIMSVQVTAEAMEELDKISVAEDVTRSVLLRHIVDEFIKSYNNE